MKRIIALLLCVVLLMLSVGAAAIGSTAMSLSDTYELAFFYLDASGMLNVQMLVEAEKRFAECADSFYEYSNNYMILTQALICTANGEYDNALLFINTLADSSQTSFVEDLLSKYISRINSLDSLKIYIDGRKYEAAGSYAQAISLYEQCKILDVSTRIINIRTLFPSRLEQAKQLVAEGNYTLAANIMQDLANAGYTNENSEAYALFIQLSDWDPRYATARSLLKEGRYGEASSILQQLTNEGYVKANDLNALVSDCVSAQQLVQQRSEEAFLAAKEILTALINDKGFGEAAGFLNQLQQALDAVAAARDFEARGDYASAESYYQQAAANGLDVLDRIIAVPTITPAPAEAYGKISDFKGSFTAQAKSEYQPKHNSYNTDAMMVIDGNLTTAWNEGAQGNGVGEWIEIAPNTSSQFIFTGFRIANGFQYHTYSKGDRYYKNNRISKVTVTLDGCFVGSYDIEDQYDGYQTIYFSEAFVGRVLRLTIDNVFPHKSGGFDEACISEILPF